MSSPVAKSKCPESTTKCFPLLPHLHRGTAEQRGRRDILRSAMENEGFSVFESELWHFDFKDWQHYGIGNTPFERMR